MKLSERLALRDWHKSEQRMAQHQDNAARYRRIAERIGQVLLFIGFAAILLWLTGPDADAFIYGLAQGVWK